ncbi:MAG: cell division FtsK/SpoIIIE [Myxococcales bacterium]|nr:cell division FtsK/SpoIIIE [Myxococcales bacterium]
MGSRSERALSSGATGGRGREVAGIVLLGLAIFVGLSVASLQVGTGTLMGPCGATVGLGVYALVGVGSYLVAFGLGFAALRCLQGQPVRVKSVAFWAAFGAGVSSAIFLHLALGSHRLRGHSPGGVVGEYGAELMVSFVGRVGAFLFATVTLAVSLVLSTPLSFRSIPEYLAAGGRGALGMLSRTVALIFPPHDDEDDELIEARAEKPNKRIKKKDVDDTVHEQEAEVAEADVLEAARLLEAPKRAKKKRDDEPQVYKLPSVAASQESAPAEIIDGEKTEINDAAPLPLLGPKIVEPVAIKKKELAPKSPEAPKPDFIPAAGGYHLPDVNLLDYEESHEDKIDKGAMLALADKLQKTLADYGVKGTVEEIHPGPVVTMYEFVPAPGTKLSKISALSNDLAMSLQALRVRIVAPIPGKGSVGIEVPNKGRATVYLKEVLVDEQVQKAKSKLTIGLGKDIAGAPVAVDLAKMPHLLVAGTTGSGKSVAVNGMICSILFNSTPEEVRMIMIDPKMVELSIYEGIPHLLLPVVTDPKKANLALRWAVDEMERRYEAVSKSGVRDILAYNKKIEKILADGPPKIESKKIKIFVEGDDGNKNEIEVSANEAAVREAGGVVDAEVRDDISAAHAAFHKAQQDAPPPPRKLPYIVVIIDEFADLMMVAPKDVETSVARIAQKARAVGIHLLLATQRPSVDVITGLIKANFPSRIAFQVASKIDSRTILDQQGAENLLGMGDMLFTDRGQALRRVHGALVTDTEIKRMVDFLKLQGQPVYDMDILKPRVDEEGDGEGGGATAEEGDDPLYDQAVRIVCETRMASVSMIQRRLQIGFNRASRLVERMERDGIVGAPNGSKPREVLAQAI